MPSTERATTVKPQVYNFGASSATYIGRGATLAPGRERRKRPEGFEKQTRRVPETTQKCGVMVKSVVWGLAANHLDADWSVSISHLWGPFFHTNGHDAPSPRQPAK